MRRCWFTRRGIFLFALTFAILLPAFVGCRSSSPAAPAPDVHIRLGSYGLPADYARFDGGDCTSHVIGYRSVVWLSPDRVAVAFNTSPSCRVHSDHELTRGVLRLLVFNARGELKTERDLPYAPDGGQEIIADGEIGQGPGGTLLIRIEEARGAKSGVRLLDDQLHDADQMDRFMETRSVIDHSLVFQEGLVSHGPRTYDVFDETPLRQIRRVAVDWPTGSMGERVGARASAYVLCTQELVPGEYKFTNVIYSGAHRRCEVKVETADGARWAAALKQDEVAELLGTLDDGELAAIVRGPRKPEELVLWSKSSPVQLLPWFPGGYETKLDSVAGMMDRYVGVGARDDGPLCGAVGISCGEKAPRRLMIFDRCSKTPLVDRTFGSSSRAGLAPDGAHYATFESGELRIYSLSGARK